MASRSSWWADHERPLGSNTTGSSAKTIRPQLLDTILDTSADTVVQQLRKLREGAGLTVERMASCDALMSALAVGDPETAVRRLIVAVEGMDDTMRVRTLKVDYGLDFSALVGREPVERERSWLGERRNAYAAVIGRDVKTLARWSDRAVVELRGLLLSDTFTGHLYVVAAVQGSRIHSTTWIQEPLDAERDGMTERSSLEIVNHSAEPSMPCLLYAYPRDWRPASLTLAVAFLSESHPEHVWATYSNNITKLPYGEQRYPLTIQEDRATCKFVRPRTDHLYGIWWI